MACNGESLGGFIVDDDEESWSTSSDDDLDAIPRYKLRTAKLKNEHRCVYLRQGVGDIYTLPMEAPNPQNGKIQKANSICTTGCTTCVGVYIPIDEKRCFAAHFDSSLSEIDKDRNVDTWQVPDDLIPGFEAAIRSSLDEAFKGMQQAVRAIREQDDLKEQIVIVCAWPVVAGKKATGSHTIDILCDYFQLDKDKLISKYSGHHGFIVDHLSKEVRLLGWTRPAPTEHDFDEMAKIANGGDKPEWGLNLRSVIQATYDYVMPDSLGWEGLLPDLDREEKMWMFEHEDGVWHRGLKREVVPPAPLPKRSPISRYGCCR